MILDFTSRLALLSRENLFFPCLKFLYFSLFPKKNLVIWSSKEIFPLTTNTNSYGTKNNVYILVPLWVCNILKTKYIFLPFEEEISTIEIDLAYLCVIIIRTKQLLQRIHYELSKSNLYHFMSFSPKRKYFYDVNKKVFILKKSRQQKAKDSFCKYDIFLCLLLLICLPLFTAAACSDLYMQHIEKLCVGLIFLLNKWFPLFNSRIDSSLYFLGTKLLTKQD